MAGSHIHHIKPVCIGGSNRFRNLDLIASTVHTRLHAKVLDVQTFATPTGVTQDFIIPVRIDRRYIKGISRRAARRRIESRPELFAALDADF